MRVFAFLIAFLVLPAYAMADRYDVLYDQSDITFAGDHAGKRFEGVFKEWQADIIFDHENPSGSQATITIDVKSAETGTKLYDGALPEADWFDTDNHPQAKYVLNSVSKTENGYQAEGDLTLKGITQPVTFDFTLTGNDPVTMQAEFPINRLDFNIGTDSDPEAEWVNEEIMINLNVTAEKN